MKRYLITAMLVLCIAAGAYYAYYHAGTYISPGGDKENGEVNTEFRAEGSSFYAVSGGKEEPLVLRGVQMSSAVPGHHLSDYAAEESDYLRWIENASDMGANLIHVTGIMDEDFYNAVCEFNTDRADPVYIMQGILLDDETANAEGSAYSNGIMDELIQNGKDAVDVIHGRKNIMNAGISGNGAFRKDVSQWVVGILIDQEWSSDVIARTDADTGREPGYRGRFVSAAADAGMFDSMMAEALDSITAYETDKYGVQRPAGFTSGPGTDFLEYENVYARQLSKYASLDPENLKALTGMKAGIFAAYRLLDFCPDFDKYLSQECLSRLGTRLEGMNRDEVYDGYIDLLSRYHTIPVIALYGISSARGPVTTGVDPVNEKEQGENLAIISRTVEADGLAGGIIDSWQDKWSTKSWNTAFAQETSRNYMWHDLQTAAQGTGLMAFAPGESAVCIPDGDKSEWTDRDCFYDRDGIRLSARYDAEGLYILAEGVDREGTWILPIDTKDGTGASGIEGSAAVFTGGAEFVLRLSGEKDTRLLVQERYDAVRERFLYDIEGRDAFIHFPDPDSHTFVPVTIPLENQTMVDILTPETRALKRLGIYETGHLVHGIMNPGSESYNSLADFCFGSGFAEIRIPWLLLNIGDPSNMLAHDDYYENYGVEMSRIRKIRIGAGQEKAGSNTDENSIEMDPVTVRGWKYAPEYRERLKQSYYVIQREWK